MISSIVEKLRDPEYRHAFVASQMNVGIPFQIRALLKARGRTQDWLAKKTGMLQPRISGLMRPGKTRPNIETLRRVAEAFDCGLAVRFVPFTELAEWSERFDPESFNVPDFNAEMTLVGRKQAAASVREQGLTVGASGAPNPSVTHFIAGTQAANAAGGACLFSIGTAAATLTGSSMAAGVPDPGPIVDLHLAPNRIEPQQAANSTAPGSTPSLERRSPTPVVPIDGGIPKYRRTPTKIRGRRSCYA